MEGHIEIVRLLCDHGADIEAVNFYGRRPLPMAAMSCQISIVKALFEARNAEINARDDDGRTALWYARVNGHANIVSYLISHGAIEYDDEDDDDDGVDDDDTVVVVEEEEEEEEEDDDDDDDDEEEEDEEDE